MTDGLCELCGAPDVCPQCAGANARAEDLGEDRARVVNPSPFGGFGDVLDLDVPDFHKGYAEGQRLREQREERAPPRRWTANIGMMLDPLRFDDHPEDDDDE